ncbi:hypothetical protein HBI56_128110 [Parastagonospora nodorum]|nr:hypothetical protein HBH53_177210 [Parastagonospora nodorum]KAH3970494.1 hypothetical protein HBH52_168910 [Parastagonospora nodorum]KAH3996613.1 hypothetical protein HBI10_149950 [Parastagonospora nodorum]KAH4009098.1 hypothetical protein HBI13_224020 [Parastagonospora nodorum]KAH4116660.1 hypothetical protein HBH47_166550 [Parastagonospora nodorum]
MKIYVYASWLHRLNRRCNTVYIAASYSGVRCDITVTRACIAYWSPALQEISTDLILKFFRFEFEYDRNSLPCIRIRGRYTASHPNPSRN